jgi:hypothetical protein
MANRKDPSHEKPDRGKRVSKKTPKATAAAEAKKGATVTKGGKKGSKSQAGAKRNVRGHSIVEESGEESESEVENEKDDEKLKIMYDLHILDCQHILMSGKLGRPTDMGTNCCNHGQPDDQAGLVPISWGKRLNH